MVDENHTRGIGMKPFKTRQFLQLDMQHDGRRNEGRTHPKRHQVLYVGILLLQFRVPNPSFLAQL